MTDSLEFKIATEQCEFEQIHRLNYQTFVEEIPQHRPGSDGNLTDKFHDQNAYVICTSQRNLIAMIAIRDKRPFSLDAKLDNLDSLLPKSNSICELRLLSVKKEFRRSRIFYGLLATAAQYCESQGYDLAIMSGLLKQQKLYKHLGFVPFGPVVGNGEASFQPMYMTFKDYQKVLRPLSQTQGGLARGFVNLLPGPVEVEPDVKEAFSRIPISHRSQEYLKMHKDTQRQLCNLANSKFVEIFMGSGTLANDVIAGQLSLTGEKGLIISNGEFGERIIEQAKRFNLNFETLSLDWGQKFDSETIEKSIKNDSQIKWLWAVHCETSTGMLNDLEMLKSVCVNYKILLCLDCVSSIGTIRVDLKDVFLASGVSGKSLGAFPGLAMVFYNQSLPPSTGKLPSYLDLAFYAEKNGVPFTISSNLVNALHTSLNDFNLQKRLAFVSETSAWLKIELRKIGANILVSDECASPFVITIKLPDGLNSEKIGDLLKTKGFFISYKSDYLVKRNWIQICLMGQFSRENLQSLLQALESFIPPRPAIQSVSETASGLKKSVLDSIS